MFDFPDSEPLKKAIAAVYEKGGFAAAVCHGPVGMVDYCVHFMFGVLFFCFKEVVMAYKYPFHFQLNLYM